VTVRDRFGSALNRDERTVDVPAFGDRPGLSWVVPLYQGEPILAVAALDEEWTRRRAELDSLFSPTIPPLERLRKYCEYGYRFQSEIKAKCGCVLGCPLFSLGAEISTREDELQKKINEILNQKKKYLESAIRDAHSEGLIRVADPAAKAQMLFAYYQGLLTQARIQNDLELFHQAIQGTFELLGVNDPASVPA